MSLLTPRYTKFLIVTADSPDGREDAVFFDGVIDERFVAANTFSRNPKGRDRRTTNHTVLEPRTFEASLIVDRSPLEGFEVVYGPDGVAGQGGVQLRSILPEAPAGERRLSEVFVALEGLRGRRLNLYTRKTGVLRGFQIKSVQIDSDRQSNPSYRLAFEEILDAYSETVFIPRIGEGRKQKAREECPTSEEPVPDASRAPESGSIAHALTRPRGPNGETGLQLALEAAPDIRGFLGDLLRVLTSGSQVR
jgi:hypothetical protein